MPKQLVVILGMHRSGTSLIASSMPLLGYSLGDNLMPGGGDNPKGFFEDLDMVAFNDALLAHNYSSWDSPLNGIVSETTSTPELEARAQELLKTKFAETDRWAVKDPRMCLLMPFWQEQFKALGIEAVSIVVHRNPLDVAASLERRNSFDKRHCLLLDYIYNRTLLRFLGDEVFVVGYNAFLDRPGSELSRIASHLDARVDTLGLETFVKESVDPQLRHYGYGDKDLETDPAAFPSLLKISRLMTELSDGRRATVNQLVRSLPEDVQLERELLALQLRRDVESRRQSEAIELALKQDIESLKVERKRLGADIEDRNRQLQEREKHISLLQDEVAKLDDTLRQSSQIISERDQQILDEREEKRSELEAVSHHLDAARSTVNHQVREISQLGDLVSDLYKKEEEGRAQIEGYQQHIRDYDRVHRELLNSVSFRLGRLITYPVRKPFTSFVISRLPEDSVSLRIIGFLRSCISHPLATFRLLSLRRIRNFYLLLTKRQDLVDQVISSYEEVLVPTEPEPDPSVHHYTDGELAGLSLRFPVYENPRVSVVIPVYNQIDYTLKCLESISHNLPDTSFEIVIADDCSTDPTGDVLAGVEGIKVIRHPQNLKFLRSCNRAVDFCRGDYVFLLNNDTMVKPGWLDSLVETFEVHEDAGLVGSKLVYPDGQLQEAGGIVWRDASAWNFGRLQDPEKPEYNYLREVDYVSGAAIMFPRKLFLDLGGFDDIFAPAYYEDTDLAFRIRETGKKVYYQPASVVVHFEGISNGTDEGSGLKQYQVANRDKFEDKWRSVLTADHFANGEEVFTARERSQGRTTVLVIDHYVPHFDKDAGSRSTFLYLRLLVQAGCNVKFLGDNFFRHEPYTTALQQMGIEVLYGGEYEKNWKRWLREQANYLDVIYLMRPHIAEKYIDVINQLSPKPKTIYFGHDLHYLRMQRQAQISGDGELKAEADYWRGKEYALFDKLDMIYYPSQVEVDEIRACKPDLPVKAIPLYAFEQFDVQPVNFSDRSDLLFVGGFNHPPNADGLRWFVDEVFPEILSKQRMKLNIVGSNMPQEITDLAGEDIVVHGFLSDEKLDELYRSVRLSVVPLRFGAGIKGKVLEAMDRGVPVVTTRIGAEGIPRSEDVLMIADDAERMASLIASCYNDEVSLSKHSMLARET
ncbi:MAG: glycosyltransferase, partial [Gammaproteobacteria bacterium]|nr:glycosyltransferase [Gammaproteobacteria bacterium]